MIHAVIFAGGVGSRMNSSTPKQFMDIDYKPVIIHTIERFQMHNLIDRISVVCLESRLEELRSLIAHHAMDKVKYLVPGARTGQQSIYKGLKAIYDESITPENDIVLINDGVRPFVSQEIITRCIECVKKYGSAITAAPVPDTIGLVDENTSEIFEIPDRKKCYALKAPQGFYLNDIINAHHEAMNENLYCFTNSAELFRYYGHKIYVVIDNGVNFKITAPADIEITRFLLPLWLKGESK